MALSLHSVCPSGLELARSLPQPGHCLSWGFSPSGRRHIKWPNFSQILRSASKFSICWPEVREEARDPSLLGTATPLRRSVSLLKLADQGDSDTVAYATDTEVGVHICCFRPTTFKSAPVVGSVHPLPLVVAAK